MKKQQDFSTLENFNGKTAIIYARASTKEQSTKIQIEQIELFCKQNGIIINNKFSENVSGAKEHREQLDLILNSDSMADLLIIREVSRLSREENYNDGYLKLQQLLKKYSVFVLLDNTFIPKGKIDLAQDITMMIKLFGAADERKKIKDRTSTARNKYRENPINVSTGTRYTPFGLMKAANPDYRLGINTKQIWVKNPDEWETVEKIFELKCSGLSYAQISKIVGKTQQIVIQTIKSPKIRYYIDDVVLKKCDEATAKNNTIPNPSKHHNKYKNKVFLGDTNISMVHNYTVKNGFQYAKKGGGGGTIKEEILDDIALMVINFALDVKGEQLQTIKERNKEKIDNLRSIINGLSNSIVQKNQELEKLRKKVKLFDDIEILKDLNISINQIKNEIENLNNQISNYNIQIERLESIEFNKDIIQVNKKNFEPFIEKYIDSIRCFHTEKYHHLIKVKTLNLWEDFTFEFDVLHHNKYSIIPLNIFEPALRKNIMHLSRE